MKAKNINIGGIYQHDQLGLVKVIGEYPREKREHHLFKLARENGKPFEGLNIQSARANDLSARENIYSDIQLRRLTSLFARYNELEEEFKFVVDDMARIVLAHEPYLSPSVIALRVEEVLRKSGPARSCCTAIELSRPYPQ